ncbi:MAG: hypothetical protein RMJ84_08890 [Sandaracinaceae bacterium]|nr:hypothetical protein [Sandaracinaceae bacterium]
MDWKEARKHAIGLLEVVGLREPWAYASPLPHALSHGMQQRVAVAMAMLSAQLSLSPMRPRLRSIKGLRPIFWTSPLDPKAGGGGDSFPNPSPGLDGSD